MHGAAQPHMMGIYGADVGFAWGSSAPHHCDLWGRCGVCMGQPSPTSLGSIGQIWDLWGRCGVCMGQLSPPCSPSHSTGFPRASHWFAREEPSEFEPFALGAWIGVVWFDLGAGGMLPYGCGAGKGPQALPSPCPTECGGSTWRVGGSSVCSVPYGLSTLCLGKEERMGGVGRKTPAMAIKA